MYKTHTYEDPYQQPTLYEELEENEVFTPGYDEGVYKQITPYRMTDNDEQAEFENRDSGVNISELSGTDGGEKEGEPTHDNSDHQRDVRENLSKDQSNYETMLYDQPTGSQHTQYPNMEKYYSNPSKDSTRFLAPNGTEKLEPEMRSKKEGNAQVKTIGHYRNEDGESIHIKETADTVESGNNFSGLETSLTIGSVVCKGFVNARLSIEGIYQSQVAYNLRSQHLKKIKALRQSINLSNKISRIGKYGGHLFNITSLGIDVGLAGYDIRNENYDEAFMHSLDGAVSFSAAAAFGLWGVPLYATYELIMAPSPGFQSQPLPINHPRDNTNIAPNYSPEF